MVRSPVVLDGERLVVLSVELNAVLHVRNAFTAWAQATGASVWVAPMAIKRGIESGIVVAAQAHSLGDALIDAAGTSCRHGVELLARKDDKICLQYRCDHAGAPGCGLLAPALAALAPLTGRDGFVRSLRFDRAGAVVNMIWPPAGPERADALRAVVDANASLLEPLGFRLLEVRDDATALLAETGTRPHLKVPELETLLVALQNGYYESPRRCTMEDIANHFGLSKSAIYHRMHAAEREAVRYLTAGRPLPPDDGP